MKFYSTITLKNGSQCIIRNCTEQDTEAVLENFALTHRQTDYLLSYPDESSMTVEQEAIFLKDREESPVEIELLAELGGAVVGLAGIGRIGSREKVRHRAEFGISVDRQYWGLGIGRALTRACIDCAVVAGYDQLELSVVADNSKAVALYRSAGFVEFGRNPKGFRSRFSGWQELVLMRLELNAQNGPEDS